MSATTTPDSLLEALPRSIDRFVLLGLCTQHPAPPHFRETKKGSFQKGFCH